MQNRDFWSTWGLLTCITAVGTLALAVAYSEAVAKGRLSPKQIDKGQFEVHGVHLAAAAYFEKQYKDSSRYAVKIVASPLDSHWELYGMDGFYFDNDDPRFNQSYGGLAQPPYRKDQQETSIDCELRQYESQEEQVSFHNLDFTRQMGGLKFLTLTQSQSVTTPSGITVTLPKQDYNSFARNGGFDYDGPADVMFVKFHITPSGKENALPQSALYQNYHVPVRIALFVAAPDFMNSNSMDSSDPVLTLTPADRKATHLDSLTIIVRQRAYLQDIPLALHVPIDPQPPQW